MSKEQFMTPEEAYFTSEQVDEQIEHLLQRRAAHKQTDEAELVEALQSYYHVSLLAEDRAVLAHARQRIAAELHNADLLEQKPQLVVASQVHLPVQPIRPRHTRLTRLLSGVAAVLIAGMLLASWVLIAQTAKTPAASTTGTSENLYSVHEGVAYRIDGNTGKVTWQHPVPTMKKSYPNFGDQTSLQVVDAVVYVLRNFDLYALDTRSGKQLWHITDHGNTQYLSFIVGNGRLYLYSIENAFNSYEDVKELVALNSTSGVQLWRITALNNQDDYVFGLRNGNLYAYNIPGTSESVQKLFSIDSATGNVRWSYALPVDTAFSANLLFNNFPSNTFVVENGSIYFSWVNVIYALNEQSGQEIWKKTISVEPAFTRLYFANGTLYANGDSHNIAYACVDPASQMYKGDFWRTYALAAQNGHILWNSGPGAHALNLPLTNGQLLIWSQTSNVYCVGALNAGTGKLTWQLEVPFACEEVPLPETLFSSCGVVWTDLLDGKLYLLEADSQPQDAPGNYVYHIKSFNAQTGQPLSTHQLGGAPDRIEVLGENNSLLYAYITVLHEIDGVRYYDSILVAYYLSDGTEVWRHAMPPFPPATHTNINTTPDTSETVLAP